MIAHRSPISGVDAYLDSYVATAGYDSQLILWDAKSHTSLARSNHDHLVNQCRFSSCGRFLVTASSDCTARVWSVPSLRILSVLCGHDDDVEGIAISPCNTRIATASRDHTLCIFELSGRKVATLRGHTEDVLSVEWNKDGTELLSSSDDGTVRRWSSDTGELIKSIDLEGVQTDTVVLTDEGMIYAGNDRGEIIVIKDAPIHRTNAHRAGVKRLAYSSFNRMLMSSSYDRTIKLWSISKEGQLDLVFSTDVPAQVWLRACAFAGNSKLIFGTFGSSYCSFDYGTREWDVKKVHPTPGLNAVRVAKGAIYSVGDAGKIFQGDTVINSVDSLCNFLAHWKGRVVTGGQTGTLFDARTGQILYQHSSPLNCSVSLSRQNEDYLLVGTYTGDAFLFKWSLGGTLDLVQAVRLHDNAIKGISCNGNYLFSVCATGAAAFHRVADFELVHYIPHAHEKISNGTASLPDGRFISVSRDLKMRIWTDSSCLSIRTPHKHSIKCVAVSSRKKFIATGAYDGLVAIYDWREDAWVHVERPTAYGISSIDYSDELDRFVASSYDGKLYEIGLQ